DDVDLCWRLQQQGWTLGFNPAAMVWHHRRNSVAAYWKQQVGYGRAEALLERKWPDKYNGPGHIRWAGRIYGSGATLQLGWRAGKNRIYHGIWGMAPYQALYEPAPGLFRSLPQMPEWYLMIAVLGVLAALSAAWRPLAAFVPLTVAAALPPIVQAVLAGVRATFPISGPSGVRRARVGQRVLTSLLHLLQPLEIGRASCRERGEEEVG